MATFYFAFVESTDSTFDNAFKRNDADVFSFELTHEEGQFPRLEIQIKNPRQALLSSSRKQWCWLSYENGNLFSPLFFGRIIGAPEQIQNEIIKLNYLAKPKDFQNQKEAIAAGLRTLPLFDPIWIQPEKRLDPDIVLESRPVLWHIDRTSLNVSLSHIIDGEDGTIDLNNNVIYDSVDVNYSTPPLEKVDVEGTVTWTEKVKGVINLGSSLKYLETFTGNGLLSAWPEYGTDIGGNWTVGVAKIVRLDTLTRDLKIFSFYDTNTNRIAAFPVYQFYINQKMNYKADRARSETVKFTVYGGVQNIFANKTEEMTDIFSVSTTDIDKPIDENTPPLVKNLTRTYFKIPRGRQSIEYLMAVATTKILSRSRSVIVSGQTNFESGIGFSCRKNLTFDDSRVSSNIFVGKIIDYTLFCNGDTGETGAKFTIGCSVGNGAITTVASGSPTYVDNYVSGYQFYDGAEFLFPSGGITFQDFSNARINDDGLDFSNFTKSNALFLVKILNPYNEQVGRLYASGSARYNAWTLNINATEVIIVMKDIETGPFETTYNLNVSELSVPKSIDLIS